MKRMNNDPKPMGFFKFWKASIKIYSALWWGFLPMNFSVLNPIEAVMAYRRYRKAHLADVRDNPKFYREDM